MDFGYAVSDVVRVFDEATNRTCSMETFLAQADKSYIPADYGAVNPKLIIVFSDGNWLHRHVKDMFEYEKWGESEFEYWSCVKGAPIKLPTSWTEGDVKIFSTWEDWGDWEDYEDAQTRHMESLGIGHL